MAVTFLYQESSLKRNRGEYLRSSNVIKAKRKCEKMKLKLVEFHVCQTKRKLKSGSYVILTGKIPCYKLLRNFSKRNFEKKTKETKFLTT